jgi:L-amino acid N-acyltransferase YncA
MTRRAELKDHAAILSIYNHYVERSVSAFDLKPRSLDENLKWFQEHDESHPIIVAEDGGEVCGWASLSRWAPHEAYAHTVELSVFVHPGFRGRGHGRALFAEILRMAAELGHHCVVSRVAEGNEASRTMHENAGFSYVGVMSEAGRKFGRWLDVHIYQKIIRGSGEGA